jgi:hypothetical protein
LFLFIDYEIQSFLFASELFWSTTHKIRHSSDIPARIIEKDGHLIVQPPNIPLEEKETSFIIGL